jgi:hypothetical protein
MAAEHLLNLPLSELQHQSIQKKLFQTPDGNTPWSMNKFLRMVRQASTIGPPRFSCREPRVRD